MEAYGRACAVTHEHSLPALEASHIQPYAKHGPHDVRNGVLLRADLHRLFDQGYVTITPEHRIEVSSRLKEDYRNGRSTTRCMGLLCLFPRRRPMRPARTSVRRRRLVRQHPAHRTSSASAFISERSRLPVV